MSNVIRLLDENTANRIAAGEVVERPSSVVKELVENAIDAGAHLIEIRLEEGGKRRIEVLDDGCGMSPEDAVLALQRHATSKIRTSDDLFAIRTLGFRGEALPSIASVSRMTLTTRQAGEAVGTRVEVEGGNILRVGEVGGREGTHVVVEDLFHNTPARLKFLKATATETARAVDTAANLAIAYPHIAIRMHQGRQVLFETPGGGDARVALGAVWGRDIARKLIPILHESPGLVVRGYVCTPDISRPGRSHELVFVNGRPVRNRLICHALEEAFRSLTPESRFPVGAIFVEIDPSMVDVNVHPSKTEVKFTQDRDVHHAAYRAVKDALLAYGILPVIGGEGLSISSGARPAPTSPEQRSLPGAEFRQYAAAAVEAFRPILPDSRPPAHPEVDAPAVYAADEVSSAGPRPFAEQLRGFRVLGQAANTYIVAVTAHGVAFVDQHTAHERVLYERLTRQRTEQGVASQHLAVPITLTLGAAEAALVSQRLGDFAAIGWEIEEFGRESFLVRAAPVYARSRNPEGLLRDMIDELAHLSVARRLVVQREHVTITNACKMAVKAGDPLNLEEMQGLLQQLAETENPYLCPHGRPIVVTVPFTELERRFKRA